MTDKKLEIIYKIKKLGKELGEVYKSNLKIDVNVNPEYDSVKVNITEYNI